MVFKPPKAPTNDERIAEIVVKWKNKVLSIRKEIKYIGASYCLESG